MWKSNELKKPLDDKKLQEGLDIQQIEWTIQIQQIIQFLYFIKTIFKNIKSKRVCWG